MLVVTTIRVRPNLPSLQCGTEGCSHRHALESCSHPPPHNSHRPYPNTMLCLLSPPPTNYFAIPILLTATSSLFRLLFTVKQSPSQSYSAVGLLFISLVFFCSLSFSLAGSLSERLSCWSTVHREPRTTTARITKINK